MNMWYGGAIGAALAITLVACAPAPKAVGQKLFMENCVVCHGRNATGGGPLVEGLGRDVPDLRYISARAGGEFPLVDVISTIDGYTRTREGQTAMPEFGPDLQAGPLVYLDTGDGARTPTPSRLVALAEYLRSIQR